MFDVIVIGGGPAGVTAALRASELGARVALVEGDRLGGTCTNDGCVPTRVLAKAARLIRDAEQFPDYALVGEKPVVDFPALLARTQEVVYAIHEKKQLWAHLARAGVAVYDKFGPAAFADAHTITLGDGRRLEAQTFIISAGGHARRLPFPGGEHALTHSDIWSLPGLPQSLAIIGGAATGCQLASIFNTFGTRVWLLDVAPRLLGAEDEEVSRAMGAALQGRGIEVVTGIGGIERIDALSEGFQLLYKVGDQLQTLPVERVVLAIGWPGNVETLNLAAAGVQTERGYIKVDDSLRTSAAHIFAAGDITGRMMLVQGASGEALAAAENAVGGSARSFVHRIVPHGGFTDPEYAGVGLTEAQARAGQECAVAVVPYSDLDRAVIDGRAEGMCKLIVAKESRRLLGAHLVGEQAVEVVQLVAAGMAADMRIEQLAALEIAYPTFAAIVGLAARRVVRELGIAAPAPSWRELWRPSGAEWEQRDGGEL
jgi:pyruvate/2-oxoglutarate dehydrogenase complex dihydrolipoamide dehydrogenase (E3) component